MAISTKTSPSNVATNLCHYYCKIQLVIPLIKGHLSNVAIISWQTAWPYQSGTTVFYFHWWIAGNLACGLRKAQQNSTSY